MYKVDEILEWAADRNLLLQSTPLKQLRKSQEELFEVMEALLNGDKKEARKEYGDLYVTMVIGSYLAGLSLQECIEDAFDSIKDRTGSVKDGVFVKDEDTD